VRVGPIASSRVTLSDGDGTEASESGAEASRMVIASGG
jgi:hypothetical protein